MVNSLGVEFRLGDGIIWPRRYGWISAAVHLAANAVDEGARYAGDLRVVSDCVAGDGRVLRVIGERDSGDWIPNRLLRNDDRRVSDGVEFATPSTMNFISLPAGSRLKLSQAEILRTGLLSNFVGSSPPGTRAETRGGGADDH
jgi:hypothetical protein